MALAYLSCQQQHCIQLHWNSLSEMSGPTTGGGFCGVEVGLPRDMGVLRLRADPESYHFGSTATPNRHRQLHFLPTSFFSFCTTIHGLETVSLKLSLCSLCDTNSLSKNLFGKGFRSTYPGTKLDLSHIKSFSAHRLIPTSSKLMFAMSPFARVTGMLGALRIKAPPTFLQFMRSRGRQSFGSSSFRSIDSTMKEEEDEEERKSQIVSLVQIATDD